MRPLTLHHALNVGKYFWELMSFLINETRNVSPASLASSSVRNIILRSPICIPFCQRRSSVFEKRFQTLMKTDAVAVTDMEKVLITLASVCALKFFCIVSRAELKILLSVRCDDLRMAHRIAA